MTKAVEKKLGGLYMNTVIWEGLKKLAKKENRSFNSYVNIILEEHWENNKETTNKLVKRKRRVS